MTVGFSGDMRPFSRFLLTSAGGGKKHILVGGFNPSEKYARQMGSFPQIQAKIKNL